MCLHRTCEPTVPALYRHDCVSPGRVREEMKQSMSVEMGGEMREKEGRGPLMCINGIGGLQLPQWPPLDCAKSQEAKLTFSCKSEISLFGFENAVFALLSSTGEMSPVFLTVKNK